MASSKADLAMEELAKANNSITKLGSDAIAREATMAQMQRNLEKFQEASQRAQEKIVDLQNKEIQNLYRISVLERDWTKTVGDLEVAKVEASDA